MNIGIGIGLTFGQLGEEGGQTYLEKVLSLSPLAYWPLNELTGTVADNAEGTAAMDGTYSGVTLDSIEGPVAGERAGLWDGVNDYCNIYSAPLASAFNGQELTFAGWFRVSGVGVWTDSTARKFFSVEVDGNNILSIGRVASNGTVRWQYTAGGTTDQRDKGSLSTTAWFHAAITVSLANDRMRAYWNGIQEGADVTTLGTWVGSPVANGTVIGARNTTPGLPFSGYAAHVALWDSELSAAAVLDLAVV